LVVSVFIVELTAFTNFRVAAAFAASIGTTVIEYGESRPAVPAIAALIVRHD
jgi:hypothetical protein